VLSPDGDLSLLPFETLPGTVGGFLLDDFEISYLTAGRDVLRFGTAKGDAAEPLVLADPDFDLESRPRSIVADRPISPERLSRDLRAAQLHFGQLPGTRREGEQIAKLLGIKPWLAGAVLEKRLKKLRSPRVLHIATHGFFLRDQTAPPGDAVSKTWEIHDTIQSLLSGMSVENPLLRSGLALAGANTWLARLPVPEDAEDGILTAEDVTALHLLETELVVLSACETGLGHVHIGEGVFGLRRAFTLAGAKTLVMSLWKVPDQETQELMVDFYQHLLSGRPRADALRRAQLAMKQRRPHPYYWGAFICQGDPGPLPLPTDKHRHIP
jgi:CHAT domain-containing protein